MSKKIEWKDAQESVLKENGNMLVSASAGTGKTTVMLEKVMRLLEKGENLDRILIITFSNASAQEMKEKLIKKIYTRLREKTPKKPHFKKQLDLIDFSNISTMDSFFFNIFKMFYAEIGYDPAFDIADEKEVGLFFNDAIDQVLEEYLSQKDDEFFALMERFVKARDISPLKNAIADISGFINKQKDPLQFKQKAVEILKLSIDKNPAIIFYYQHHKNILRKVENELKNLLKEIEFETPLLYDKYKDFIKDLMYILVIIYNKDNIKDFAKAIKSTTFLNKPSVRNLSDEEKKYNKKVVTTYNYIKKYINDLKEDLSEQFTGEKHLLSSVNDVKKLMEIVFKVRKRYAVNKQKRKKLDFADLSLLAMEILKIESCREKVRESFDYIFVDEYQDTNYIQEEIIKRCSKPNNLFTVGDPKQSIYQFRDAQPQIFFDRYNHYESQKTGANKNLNDNFRSDKKILDFVNLIFCEIMNSEFGGVDYRQNALLVADKPFPKVSDIPSVEIFDFEKPKKQNRIDGVYSVKKDSKENEDFDIQSIYVADKVDSLVGKKYIYDKDLKEKRLVEYRDIAILMYRRDEAILKELQKRQIPFTAPGFNKGKVYEIELLVDYLRLLNNVFDDIALTSVMLSPVYSFSPKELLQIRKNSAKESFWESLIQYNGNQNIQLKIETLLNDIDKHSKMSSYMSVYELMLYILSEGFDAYFLKKGELTIERVNNFINGLKDSEVTKSLSSFLEYYDNSRQEINQPSTMTNAIKITTIHKSKGLEFPIVFVADAHKGYNSSYTNDKDLFTDSEFGIAVKHFDTENKTKSHTLLTKSHLLKSQYREKEELMRLMYVAFTRAQNHLFICGERDSKKNIFALQAKSFMQWIYYACDKNSIIENYFCKKDIFIEEEKFSEKQKIISQTTDIDLKSLRNEYKYKIATQMPLKYSVTSLKEYQKGYEEDYKSKNSYLTREESLQRGVFYHKILELIDFEKSEKYQIKDQLDSFVREGLLDEDTRHNADIDVISKILHSSIIQYARKNKYFREKAFMLYLPMNEIIENSLCKDKVLVQGIIDLLILGEKNYIVDFKVTQSEHKEVLKRYEQQLSIYRKAVETLMGVKIHKSYIYLINQNKLLTL